MASGSRSIHKGSDQIFDHDCNVCQNQGITSEGISYCTVCNEYLCQTCERSHKGSKASMDHRLLTGSAVPSVSIQRKQVPKIMLCDTHKTSIIELICEEHQQVICNICKVTNHAKCRTADVARQVKKEKSSINNSFKTAMKDLSDITDKFNNLQTSRQADKTSIKGHIQTCLNDLQKIRKDINDKFDKLEQKMTREIREFENQISKEIGGHDAMLKKILFQIGDLNKSLIECQKLREDDVMFVGMKKASSQNEEFEKILTNIQEDISPINIRLEPNEILTDVIDQLNSLGTLVTCQQAGHSRSAPTSVPNKAGLDKQTGHSRSAPTSVPKKAGLVKQVSDRSAPKSLLNIKVTGKREEIDLKSDGAQGCVFMGDGHLVVAFLDRLKLYDKDCRYKSEIDITSYDVAVIDDYTVIVTQGSNKQLQYVQVLPDMKVVRTVTMDRWCWGVDVCGDKLYVTCHGGPGKGEVQVLTMDGIVLRTLDVDNGKYMFIEPFYVKVSKTGDKVFVSDYDTDIITCLSTQGRTLYKYTDTDLTYPQGMYVDETDNLLVCGEWSHNIHVVRHDGTRDRILLTQKDGIKNPDAISYRPSDGCLAVVQNNPSRLLTFSTKI